MGCGTKVRAFLYLHTLRTWRYKYSFINMTLNLGLWISIFILGALVFVPPENLPDTAPYIFWGVILWNVLSSCVWSLGGWTWFFLSMGMYEEHKLHNTSVVSVLAGRTITVLTDIALITPVMYFVVTKATGGSVTLVTNPAFIVGGFVAMFIMSLSYGLTLSELSLRIGVPGTLLDISNFLLLVMGGIAVPISKLPGPIQNIAVLIPYAHASELVRYGATGMETYLPLHVEVVIVMILSTSMMVSALALYRYVEDHYLRRYGPRAIGRM